MVKTKIAFASEENISLDGRLPHHLGRCSYYVFVEIEDGEVKVNLKEAGKNQFVRECWDAFAGRHVSSLS